MGQPDFANAVRLVALLILAWVGTPLDLLRLAEAPPGPGVPPGWKIRPVGGQSAPHSEIRQEPDSRTFRVHGAGRAAWFYRELAPPISEASGSLHWSWRVLEAPGTSDLRRKKTDDSPIRILVVFGKPHGLFAGSGRVLFYTFGNTEPEGFERVSHVSSRYHIVRVDGAAERGGWRSHAVSVFADYRRLWRRDPPPITAVGVMQDTDQTGAPAVAELRQLEWITR